MTEQLGLELRDAGLELTERNNKEFIELMRTVATILINRRPYITTDMLRSWAEAEGIAPKSDQAWGAVLSQGQRVGDTELKWVVVGRERSVRPKAHGRFICQWKLGV